MCDVYGFNERKKNKWEKAKRRNWLQLQSEISKFGKRDEMSIVMASNLRRIIIKWDARECEFDWLLLF